MSTVSVIMSVYNEERFIFDAINSILTQTFHDWEMVIIDDGSKDKTVDIIKTFNDGRIRLIQNEKNQGLVHNLNMGLSLVNSKYIARMDGDDICVPTRFSKQVEYLDKHQDVCLVGSQVKTFGDRKNVWRPNDNSELLRTGMLLRPVLAHPSIMIRNDVLKENNLCYSNEYKSAQDYDFINRVAECGKIGVVEEVLLNYRIHKTQVTSKGNAEQSNHADKIRDEIMKKLSVSLMETEFIIYKKWAMEHNRTTVNEYLEARNLIHKFLIANEKTKYYDEYVFQENLERLYIQWIISSKTPSIYIRIPKLCKSIKKNRVLLLNEIIRRLKR
ncbi:MAG TPA: glycosyltransferase family 2 protein [Sedimentibacter sp.]|nr:glycosyltransferase family 2 protein [Sedimentibacter sp.]